MYRKKIAETQKQKRSGKLNRCFFPCTQFYVRVFPFGCIKSNWFDESKRHTRLTQQIEQSSKSLHRTQINETMAINSSQSCSKTAALNYDSLAFSLCLCLCVSVCARDSADQLSQQRSRASL